MAKLIIQKQPTEVLILYPVAMFLYRNLIDRTRSRSTLIAVSVSKETPHKVVLITYVKYLINRQTSYSSSPVSKVLLMKSGCEMRPTQRWLEAKERNNTLDGVGRANCFCRAIKIRILPHEAAMARKMFTMPMNKYQVSNCFTSLDVPVATQEHTASCTSFSEELGIPVVNNKVFRA